MPTKKFILSKYFLLSSILFGTSLIVVGIYFLLYERTVLSFNRSPNMGVAAIDQKARPTKVEIKDLKINLSVSESQIVNGVWEISKSGASHLNTSANPGEGGNIVIYGHNKKAIFGSLPYARVGSKIKITTEDGQVHNYEVVKKDTVKPNNLSYVLSTTSENLTLYTCTGFLDSERFVITAIPI